MKQGTTWTEPGSGSTVLELRQAINASSYFSHRYHGGRPIAEQAYNRLADRSDAEATTNLKLTGAPLNEYDLRRLEVCE
jgi:hypothetical protein